MGRNATLQDDLRSAIDVAPDQRYKVPHQDIKIHLSESTFTVDPVE